MDGKSERTRRLQGEVGVADRATVKSENVNQNLDQRKNASLP